MRLLGEGFHTLIKVDIVHFGPVKYCRQPHGFKTHLLGGGDTKVPCFPLQPMWDLTLSNNTGALQGDTSGKMKALSNKTYSCSLSSFNSASDMYENHTMKRIDSDPPVETSKAKTLTWRISDHTRLKIE